MPIVHIDLIEGRSDEQLKKMVKEVTDAIERTAVAPRDDIRIVINEMKKNNYSVGGTLKSDAK